MRTLPLIIVLTLAQGCSEESGPTEPSNTGDTTQTEETTQVDEEITPLDTDDDGIVDDEDPCPTDPSNQDTDEDGICDGDDPCPEDGNETLDTDFDGACDGNDDCPDDPSGSVDSNADGLCNGEDDMDGDGISNAEERMYGDDCAVSNPALADTDRDGIEDNEDPYPRDPWPEFILYRNDLGSIDLLLSNRNGTFEPAIEVGDLYGDTANTSYRYIGFTISDFDDDGRMDFLAIADPDPSDDDYTYDVWWFWREKADELRQRLLGQNTGSPFGTIADFDNDELVDLIGIEAERPSNIESVVLRFYSNQRRTASANCFASDNPENPDGCAFITREAVDVTPWAADQWIYRQSRDAIDVNGDGNVDIAISRIASGGNSANVPITVVFGRGDGTFDTPTNPLFSHNTATCGGSPANSLLFGDFDHDGIGDVVTGLDDDGDAGSAWFYPGTLASGSYGVDSTRCTESFDLNPTHESGSEHPGVSSSARNFDFDFDGIQDVMVGYHYEQPWAGPSMTVLLLGNGDGTFGAPMVVRDFPDSDFGNRFAVPKRLCTRFPM